MIPVLNLFSIPLYEIEFSFVRSSGPGGQNVNKVNSKAVLRWNVLESQSLPEKIRLNLTSRLKNQLTKLGEIVITSDRFRDQLRNREDCIKKLQDLLVRVSKVEKPRKKTKPSRSKREKLRVKKTKHSVKKQLRRKSNYD